MSVELAVAIRRSVRDTAKQKLDRHNQRSAFMDEATAASGFEPTQLRNYYDAMDALKEQELTALAECHAKDPELVAYRFDLSVKKAETYLSLEDQPFHPERPPLIPPSPDTPLNIRSTVDFARYLNSIGSFDVDDNLSFEYVDREIFPLRSTEKGGPRTDPRKLDLLLKSGDGLPVLTELKIRGDKPSYFALMQNLMYASELSSRSQISRLIGQHKDHHFEVPDDGPVVDLQIIAFDPPKSGEFRKRSTDATETICQKLAKDPRIGSRIRRFTFLTVAESDSPLVFEKLFSFDTTR